MSVFVCGVTNAHVYRVHADYLVGMLIIFSRFRDRVVRIIDAMLFFASHDVAGWGYRRSHYYIITVGSGNIVTRSSLGTPKMW